MIKLVFGICFVIVLTSCSSYDYNVSKLERSEVSFLDLPNEVQSFFNDPSKYKFHSKIEENLGIRQIVCLDVDNFEVKTIKTIIGPWVSYEKLIDTKNNISYKINYEIPWPYVIYKNKLYLTDKYNIFTTVEDFSKLKWNCYNLKEV